MKYFLTLLVAVAAVACGGDNGSDSNATSTMNMAESRDAGKADDATQTEPETVGGPDENMSEEPSSDDTADEERAIDLCAEFELYGDGECHTFCEEPDSDCTPEELEAARDICDEEGRYGDGQCDEDCRFFDRDCEPEPDACISDARYADGMCDTDCDFTDSDCDDYEPLSSEELSANEKDSCEGFGRQGPDLARDLATSYCLAREDAALVDCITQCVEASRRD